MGDERPQQPGVRRSERNPADPSFVKGRIKETPDASGEAGPIPEDNQPGHHPEHEQDKPID